MTPIEGESLSRAALRVLKGALLRDRSTLVPPAFAELWTPARFSVWYGGRAAAKSWSIARVLIIQASEAPMRVLCCREIQGSIRESAYRLLADQIQALQLDEAFDVQSDAIIAKNGGRFYFEGLRYNASKIRSYEGVDVVWVEEAQSVSELSWETLLPTIRKPGSRFFISFNPMTKEDPVAKRFVDQQDPRALVRKVSWRDNPHLAPEADAERRWLESTDPDAYRHVWEGFPREVSDALILKGKFSAESFEVRPTWAGPYHGLDYGFSRDPSAAVRCYVDDETRTLYIDAEFWALACDIDALPNRLEAAIPGISQHVVYADASRPESTSYLMRNGIPAARSAEKWPGSVDDGIAYLRSFARIVVSPACVKLLDECRTYSFKQDRLTGVPLPEPEDKNNHLIDALRYALSPLIRSKPQGGYFERSALLSAGEPYEPPPGLLGGMTGGRAMRVLAVVAMCERPGSALGIVWFAHAAHWEGCPLVAVDYDLAEPGEAFTPEWVRAQLAIGATHAAAWKASDPRPVIHCPGQALFEAIGGPASELLRAGRPEWDVRRLTVRPEWPQTVEERASSLRNAINGGTALKLAATAYAKQITFRAEVSNALASQLFGFRPGVKDAATELTDALMLGILASRMR